jgi:5'-nucleotidase
MIRTRRGAVLLAVFVALATFPLTSASAGAAAAKPPVLTVLVTNDDGVTAPGIDALVQALRKVKHTKVVVVAPASNQSGTGEHTTPGELTTRPARTASGYRATAVAGYPADAVTAALDQLGVQPDVVLSGSNAGQNLGAVTERSGTVGAAKMAVQRGIPALAVSQGVATDGAPQYGAGATLAVEWLRAHRSALLTTSTGAPTTLDNLNVPNCPAGEPRGVAKVATATTADGAGDRVDCTSSVTDPTTDIEAFTNGFAALATVRAGPRPTR